LERVKPRPNPSPRLISPWRLGLVLRVIEALGGSLDLGDLGMSIRQDEGNDDR